MVIRAYSVSTTMLINEAAWVNQMLVLEWLEFKLWNTCSWKVYVHYLS